MEGFCIRHDFLHVPKHVGRRVPHMAIARWCSRQGCVFTGGGGGGRRGRGSERKLVQGGKSVWSSICISDSKVRLESGQRDLPNHASRVGVDGHSQHQSKASSCHTHSPGAPPGPCQTDVDFVKTRKHKALAGSNSLHHAWPLHEHRTTGASVYLPRRMTQQGNTAFTKENEAARTKDHWTSPTHCPTTTCAIERPPPRACLSPAKARAAAHA